MTRTITATAERDHTVADCQQLTAGLRTHFHDGIPVEAVASWSPEQRADVAGWLEHLAAAEGAALELPHPPDWLKQVHQLHQALSPDAAAEQTWRTLRADGATDSLLESQVAAILQEQVIETTGTDWGPVCWQISPLRKPAIWFDRDTPPARGKADLSGRSLCDAVRRLYGVQLPDPPEGDRPSAGAGSSASASGKPRKRKGKQAAPVGASDGPAGERVAVPLDQVRPSPFQPRQTFDPAELESLAASMRQHGQLTDCKARRLPDGAVELIGGERRWRAAELAGLPVLNCLLVQADDRQARIMALADNLDRVDLSPLERVRAYQAMLEAGVYRTQAEAAKALGITRATLSNLLRTLQLPDVFLGLIDSGTLPLTHARYLLPLQDIPGALDKVLELHNWPEDQDPIGSVASFRERLRLAVQAVTRPGEVPKCTTFCEWLPPATTNQPDPPRRYGAMCLTAEDLERLDVRDLSGIADSLGMRSCNVPLWDQTQEMRFNEQTAEARRRKKAAAGAGGKPEQRKLTDKPAKQDPTERLRKDVAEYRRQWQLARARERVVEMGPGPDDRQALNAVLLWMLSECPDGYMVNLAELLPAAGLPRAADQQKRLRQMQKASEYQLWKCLNLLVIQWLQEEMAETQFPWIKPQQADELATLLKIDPARDWRVDRAFLELHTMQQLAELKQEWKARVVPGWMEAGTREQRIEALLKWAESRPAKQRPKAPKLLKARPS